MLNRAVEANTSVTYATLDRGMATSSRGTGWPSPCQERRIPTRGGEAKGGSWPARNAARRGRRSERVKDDAQCHLVRHQQAHLSPTSGSAVCPASSDHTHRKNTRAH